MSTRTLYAFGIGVGWGVGLAGTHGALFTGAAVLMAIYCLWLRDQPDKATP